MAGKIKVFVYGTLKKTQCRNGILKDTKFLGADTLTGTYRFIDLGAFPAVVFDATAPSRTIKGEAYLVDLDMLNSLDAIEGHPDFYRRTKVDTDKNGQAWCYLLQGRDNFRYDEVVGDSWPEGRA